MVARHAWREPPTAVAVLVASGWLTPAEAADPRLEVIQAGSSHSVFRVTTRGGRAAVVKQVPRRAAEDGRTLCRELYVYRMTAWVPCLARAIPKALFIDETRQLLAMECLTSPDDWMDATAGTLGSPDVGNQLGRLMGQWHRSTQNLAFWPSPAVGVLHLPDALDDASRGRPESTRELMRYIAFAEDLSSALREARALWTDRCLIHGDIRRENWVSTPDRDGRRLKVLDWELSGSGDPAWDVGSVLAEAALDIVRANPEHTDPLWMPRLESSIRSFVREYSRYGLVDLGDAETSRLVALYAASRLLHVALEWADVQGDAPEGLAARVVAQARLLLKGREELASILRSGRRT